MDLIKGECWEPKEDSDIISWKKEESSRRLTVANYPLIKIYHIVNVIRVNGRVNIRSPRTDTRSSCIYAFINQWNRTQESLDPTPYPYEHLQWTSLPHLEINKLTAILSLLTVMSPTTERILDENLGTHHYVKKNLWWCIRQGWHRDDTPGLCAYRAGATTLSITFERVNLVFYWN